MKDSDTAFFFFFSFVPSAPKFDYRHPIGSTLPFSLLSMAFTKLRTDYVGFTVESFRTSSAPPS
jgi:hypothetical protein